jgi:hypothetical protein
VRDDSLDKRDHVGTLSVASQCAADAAGHQVRIRRLDIELRAVVLELLDIEIRDFERRLALGTRGLFDLVLALVLVARSCARRR